MRQPSLWFAYMLIFGMPHIVASFFCFAEPVLRHACSGALVRAMALWLNARQQAIIVIDWTLLHVMDQQAGLARVGRGTGLTASA